MSCIDEKAFQEMLGLAGSELLKMGLKQQVKCSQSYENTFGIEVHTGILVGHRRYQTVFLILTVILILLTVSI